MTVKENIRKLLDILKESSDNLVQAEYVFDKIREYIEDKKEDYKEVLKEYDQDELNKVVKESYKQYVKRAQRIFFREVIFFAIYMLVITCIVAFGFKPNSNVLLMCIIGFASLFCIVRSVAFKKSLEKKTKEEYKKYVEKDVEKFVEGLKKWMNYWKK